MFERLGTYAWWEVGLELLFIFAVMYAVIRFVQGTRAAGALKGLLLVVVMSTLLVRILGQQEALERLQFLYERFLTIAAIALIVIFQPELRRGLIRLGEAPLLRRGVAGGSELVENVVDAAGRLSKARFGALIVIERDVGLRGMLEGGTVIDSRVTSRLLQTIFFPSSALHDLAVVVSKGRIQAAGVQLPLADPEDMPDPGLGSRHRAAVGLTKESDAIVVVVSEETGRISVAERGRLVMGLSVEELEKLLLRRLVTSKKKGAGSAVSVLHDTDDDAGGFSDERGASADENGVAGGKASSATGQQERAGEGAAGGGAKR